MKTPNKLTGAMKLRTLSIFPVVMTLHLAAIITGNAATLTVTNLNDLGDGSLRRAINTANDGDEIIFQVVGTIFLTSDKLVIDRRGLTITGPGARYLTISRASSTKFPIMWVHAENVSISGVTITNGYATGGSSIGGGVEVYPLVDDFYGLTYPASVTISDCAITDNVSEGYGGGVGNLSSELTMNRCTVSGNQALYGGGIAFSAVGQNLSDPNSPDSGAYSVLNNCTIVGNTAGGSTDSAGGGTESERYMEVALHNCTVSGNTANAAPGGSNQAGGGGIWNNSSQDHPGLVDIDNTIVAGNTTNQIGPDVKGDFSSYGYNLIRIKDGSPGFNQPGDQTGTAGAPLNAFLGPLQDNGGHTDTKAPGPSSPAINAGFHIRNADYGMGWEDPIDDQRGKRRPTAPLRPDIGAVEAVLPETLTVKNLTDHDPYSLRDTLVQAAPGDSIAFASRLTGAINLTSGALLIDKDVTITGPGARVLSVNGTAAGNVFTIQSGTVKILDLTIGGGFTGVEMEAGATTVRRCTISNNANGGGLYVKPGATLTLQQSTVSGNQNQVAGGGLRNDGTATLTSSTFVNNTAGDQGGGIFNYGTLKLLNCTVSGNDVTGNTYGDGGGGLYNFDSTHVARLGNTIVAGNSAPGGGADLNGDFKSDGYNLIRIADSNSTGFVNGVNHDQVGTAASPRNAFLGMLQDNGGPTDTKALGSSSPAINAGNDAVAPVKDQRGFVWTGGSDIGPYKFGGTQPPPVSLNSLASSKTHGSAGYFYINLPLTGNPGIECRSAGANGDYTLVFTFSNPLSSVGGAYVSSGTATVTSEGTGVGRGPGEYVVNLTGVENAQVISVSLTDIDDSAGNHSDSVQGTMGVLLGDVNANGRVSNSDVSSIQAQVGASVGALNFRNDVNANGTLSNGDVAAAQAQVGAQLPP